MTTNIKVNCAEVMKKFVSLARVDRNLVDIFDDISSECDDVWTNNYASIICYLAEVEYRDYDAVIRDVIDTIVKSTGSKVIINHGRNNKALPKSGIVLQTKAIHGGLTYEFELYDIAGLRKDAATEKRNFLKQNKVTKNV